MERMIMSLEKTLRFTCSRSATWIFLLLFCLGCSESASGKGPSASSGDADVDGDADADGDGDTDTDGDSDSDSDSDGDTDTDGDSDSDSDADGDIEITYDWPFDDYALDDGSNDPFSDGYWGEDGVWYQSPEFCVPPPFPNKATCKGEQSMWARALQMALWFFNINKSGPGVYCTDVQWRGAAHLSDAHIQLVAGDPNGVDMSAEYINKYRDVFDPDGNGEVDLSGGYYDAGDFIKFGLTTGYMASMISWAMFEFPEAFIETGLDGEAMDQITWSADYFMRSTFIEDKSLPAAEWNVIGYAHQVGGANDHTCGWMPPELRTPEQCPRMGYFATHEKPGADVTANNAAALALTYLVTKNARPDYAIVALNHAIALYNFAAQYPEAIAEGNGGLYTSEYAWDDLAWAAVWLYEATKDERYFDEAMEWSYHYPGFNKQCVEDLVTWESYSDSNACWTEGWTHIWNSLRSGAFVRLAASMTDAGHPHGPLFRKIAQIDTMLWLNGQHSPQGFAQKVDVGWGSGRYNAAGQFVAMVYAKHFPDDENAAAIKKWATDQSLYLLGNNEVNGDARGKSFMMGFTDITPVYPLQPHHAAGHASIYGEPDIPAENRHILWGALVNGPVGDDTHEDVRGDYGQNEVTIDYNAAWVAALAGNYVNQGATGCPDPDFPPAEPPIDEFYTMAKVDSEGECRTQVTITMMNESIHPPRFNTHLESRYYMDITDLVDAGVDPATVTASIMYDNSAQAATTIEGPIPCETNGDLYYFKLKYEDQKFWGRQSRLDGPRVTMVDFGVGNSGGCQWDGSNDYSFEGLTTEEQKTPHITAYGKGGKLLWGEEPECHEVHSVLLFE